MVLRDPLNDPVGTCTVWWSLANVVVAPTTL